MFNTDSADDGWDIFCFLVYLALKIVPQKCFVTVYDSPACFLCTVHQSEMVCNAHIVDDFCATVSQS